MRIQSKEQAVVRVWQDIACKPHQRYEVSCWVKTDDVAPGHAYIEAYGLTEDGELNELLTRPVHVSGTTDWKETVHTIETDNYDRLRIYIRIQEGAGTAWFDDIRVAGLLPRHPLENVIQTESAQVVVQNADASILYERGRDYTVEVPSLVYPYTTESIATVSLTEGSRIANGDTVLLSYTYAPPESITCCPSEPLYQEFMRKSVHHVMSYLKPKYLHIGHDEPRVLNRDVRCKQRELSNSRLFVDDIRKMRRYAREIDEDVRLMMWDDAVNPYQNAPHLEMEGAAELIPRDVIICIWWYDERQVEEQIEKSTQYFLDLGFDITGSPWFAPENAYRWAETLHRYGKKSDQVLGELYTSWAHPSSDPWAALPVAAEHAWTFGTPPFAH